MNPLHPAAGPVVHDGGIARGALTLTLLSLLGFGALYSTLGTILAGALFPAQASGSLVFRGGNAVGSALVAQPFADARYFHPRPSAASYDPMAAAGSNLARTNPELVSRIDGAVAELAARDGVAPSAVPADLVTQSGGGLDPDISPQGAKVQIARVAAARGVSEIAVARIVAAHTTPRQFGLLGQARVNVLAVNLALDGAR